MSLKREDKETIHREYVTTDISIRVLARKYGIGVSTLNRWIHDNHWTVEKRAYLQEAAEIARRKMADAAAKKMKALEDAPIPERDHEIDRYVDALAERAEKIYSSADRLLLKVNQLLELEDALAPRDLKAISSTLLDLKMIHDIEPRRETAQETVIRFSRDMDAMAE